LPEYCLKWQTFDKKRKTITPPHHYHLSNAVTKYSALAMLQKLLFEHPRQIGETYTEHASHACSIGLRMIGAGLACLVHAVLPGLCVRTASRTVNAITDLMQQRTPAPDSPAIEHASG
jgi:hypothetical protein